MSAQFYESEAVLAALATALRMRNCGTASNELLRRLSETQANALNDLIVRLVEDLPREIISITENVRSPEKVASYGMRFQRSSSASGKPSRMRFFRVQESAPALAINTLGLAISVALLSPAAIVPAVTIAKTIWENIVSIEGDHDKVAMRVYDAILIFKASQLDNHQNNPTSRSISDITAAEQEGDRVAVADVLVALRRLCELKLVSVDHWGGVGGDLDHADNRWKIVI